MRKIMLLTFFGMGFVGFSYGQSLSPTVIAAGGGTASGESMTLDWTLGETTVESVYTSDRMYTQGFQQPILNVERLDDLPKLLTGSETTTVKVSPNPVASVLNVQISKPFEFDVDVRVTDMEGQLVMHQKVPALSGGHELNVSHLSSGIYHLHMFDKDKKEIAVYRISKF